jgi:hypothetical protein
VLGTCSAFAACCSRGILDWRVCLLVSGVLIAALGVWRCSRWQVATSQLEFDGRHWVASGRVTVVRGAAVRAVLDFQSLMLVRLVRPGQPGQSGCWAWLDQRSMPERWADLRRAVYSRAPSNVSAAYPRLSMPPGPPSTLP